MEFEIRKGMTSTGIGFYNKGDEIGKSLFSLIKFNNGNWKSEKQANFMRKLGLADKDMINSRESVTGKLKENQFIIEIDADVKWAEGTRGKTVLTYFFICDDKGVVKELKSSRRWQNDDIGSYCDGFLPSNTKVAFDRAQTQLKIEEQRDIDDDPESDDIYQTDAASGSVYNQYGL